MAPQVTIRQVTAETRPVLERLWQLFRHDLSEFRGNMPDEHGEFSVNRLSPYLEDGDRAAYLLYRGSTPAGLALVRGLAAQERVLAEFFVVRAARRQRFGHEAALQLFAMHPGRWRLAFQEENPAAARFWRQVVQALVGTEWSEEARPVPGTQGLPPDIWVSFRNDLG